MTPTIIGGLALWLLSGCIVAIPLCRILKAAEAGSEGEGNRLPYDSADKAGIRAGNFIHLGNGDN